jgi:hypothetical protein
LSLNRSWTHAFSASGGVGDRNRIRRRGATVLATMVAAEDAGADAMAQTAEMSSDGLNDERWMNPDSTALAG